MRKLFAWILIAVLSTPLGGLAHTAGPQQAETVASWLSPLVPLFEGQSRTLLPDGRWLLLAGRQRDGNLATSFTWDPQSGQRAPLVNDMRTPRAWHTATVLPNGNVLVFGGVDSSGRAVQSAELFDPESASFDSAAIAPQPRVGHSATLLTDGRILVAGGVSATGQILEQAELWDPQTSRREVFPQVFARAGHRAELLADGNVLLSGGIDAVGQPVGNSELFVVDDQTFTLVNEPRKESTEVTRLEASLPEDGAIDVPVDATLALRFSRALESQSVGAETVELLGPGGVVPGKMVLAEGGRLLFITPANELVADATYILSINGAADQKGSAVAPGAMSFRTEAGTNPDRTGRRDGHPTDPRESPPTTTNVSRSALPLSGGATSLASSAALPNRGNSYSGSGGTSLKGQVLKTDGQPLADVTLKVGSRTAMSDSSGWFTVADVSAGPRELIIDGRTVNIPGEVYGVHKARVILVQDELNLLPYTIWMTRIDTANAVTIPSPTTGEVVVTTPHIPGLEVRIPANTVIKDHDGNVVSEVSITRIPMDKPPFPLPKNLQVPVYFTIQPGAGSVNSSGTQGVRLIYPNYTNDPAGTRADFWQYDPNDVGWYVYGQGAITSDNKQVVPDPGVAIYEFTGAMINVLGYNPPGTGPAPGNNSSDGDPVDLGTGLFVLSKTDLVLPDVLPIKLVRTYRPQDTANRFFGIGSTHNFEMFLWSANQYQEADVILPDGGRIHYVRISPGTGFADAEFENSSGPTSFYKSRVKWNGGGWDLTLNDGTVYVYGENAPLQSIRDRYGNKIILTRTQGATGNITRISSPNNRWIDFTYDGSNRITQAKDNIGRIVGYTYDGSGRLWKVTDPAGGVTEYTYDASHRMLTLKDARAIVFLTNEYDANGRVTRQTQADNTTYQFAYTLDGNGKVTQTDVTSPGGFVRRVTFDSSGYSLTDTASQGRPEQQTTTFERQAGTNFISSVTDALNRRTAFVYDSKGNTTSITRMSGTSEAVTTSFTYESTFNQVGSVSDPLNHTTSFAYDSKGSLTTLTDPLNNQSTFAYNPAGQPISVTNPLNKTTQFTYDFGDLASVTDPLGRTTNFFADSAGRRSAVIDALSNTTRYEYDALNHVTRMIDSLGGATAFTYDANGNTLTVTDARNGVTTYTYNNMDRVTTRQDPLLRSETYEYDNGGNMTKLTDRKSQVTAFTYDSLNRRTFAGFGETPGPVYQSTISYTYDAGNRVTQAVDSVSGTITQSFDNLDRLTSQTTPQGTVSYTFDAGSRRTGMTVAGQTAVSYNYDNANRLTAVTQGTSSVAIAYDVADHRTTLTLPNGIVAEYSYDDASQLTALTYKLNGNTLGDLTYQYDLAGRRTQTAGAYARTGLPQPLTSATYDPANQLAQWGATTVTYDANGNLTNDGTNTYMWDARNQLSSIAGGTTASFQYDPLGRRVNKTIGGASTAFLFDGANVVQELSGATPTANLLIGLNVDEIFTRTDSAGARHFFTDVLGSSLALSDADGTLLTQYTYEPFGKTSLTGAANANSFKFTGREDDSTGLYYHRARYHSPTFQRFVSEDPIGFAGGLSNLHSYVGSSPLNFVDPTGLSLWRTVFRIYTQSGKPIAQINGGTRSRVLPKITEGLGKAGPDAVLRTENETVRDRIGKVLSPDGKIAKVQQHGTYPEHIHPKSGPYARTHIQVHAPGTKFASLLAPMSMSLSGRKSTTTMQFVSGALWDIASAIDPIFLTDAISWYFALE